MAALTTDQQSISHDSRVLFYPAASGATIFIGAMLMLAANGEVVPAAEAQDGGVVLGISKTNNAKLAVGENIEIDTSDFDVKAKDGVTADATWTGKPVYVVSDREVDLQPDDPANGAVLAGTVIAVDTATNLLTVRPAIRGGAGSPGSVQSVNILLSALNDSGVVKAFHGESGKIAVTAIAVTVTGATAVGALILEVLRTSDSAVIGTINGTAAAAGEVIPSADITPANGEIDGVVDSITIQTAAGNLNTAAIDGYMTLTYSRL